MRYILFALVFSLSYLANAQQVLTKFNKQLISEDFSSAQIIFPQKYNANELFMLEGSKYLVKRINPTDYSISYARIDHPLKEFAIRAHIDLLKAKNNGGGLVVHGQKQGNGAIILEINNKKRFRVRKVFNQQEKFLTGAEHDGWVKSKQLNKKGDNVLEIRCSNGYYDIYINGTYVYTVFDLQFEEGSCGLFIQGGSEMRASRLEVMVKETSANPLNNSNNTSDSSTDSDASFQEVILLFKTKIDQQQEEIKKLQYQLDRCKSMLNYDTTLVVRSEELEIENERLSFMLDSTSKALNAAIKRLEYLESFREDVEAGSNGDLVLNLTSILAESKKENKLLKEQLSTLKAKNAELENGNDVLLREIERLRKLVELQNE